MSPSALSSELAPVTLTVAVPFTPMKSTPLPLESQHCQYCAQNVPPFEMVIVVTDPAALDRPTWKPVENREFAPSTVMVVVAPSASPALRFELRYSCPPLVTEMTAFE